jgi:hypothetical protein
MGAPRWCVPFIATGGGGRWRRKLREWWVGTAAVKPWAWGRRRPPLSEGARCGLGASVWTGHRSVGPTRFLIFPIYPKPAQH